MWSIIPGKKIFSLRDFLDETGDEKLVSEELSSFECPLDSEIETFLRKEAISYEKAHRSRTYLIVKEEPARGRHLRILGYISVALSITEIQRTVSRTKRKKLDGMFDNKNVPCYLIGQLAKNHKFKGEIDGRELVDYAMNMFRVGHELVGGRFVRVDCKKNDYVVRFYENNGFHRLRENEDGLLEFTRFLGD